MQPGTDERRSRADEALMVRSAITQAAFDAIAKTLALGSVGFENATNEKGERLIWLEPSMVDRLRAMRGPGESYSDVFLRLVGQGRLTASARRGTLLAPRPPRA
jgi:hypothetical protein